MIKKKKKKVQAAVRKMRQRPERNENCNQSKETNQLKLVERQSVNWSKEKEEAWARRKELKEAVQHQEIVFLFVAIIVV